MGRTFPLHSPHVQTVIYFLLDDDALNATASTNDRHCEAHSLGPVLSMGCGNLPDLSKEMATSQPTHKSQCIAARHDAMCNNEQNPERSPSTELRINLQAKAE